MNKSLMKVNGVYKTLKKVGPFLFLAKTSNIGRARMVQTCGRLSGEPRGRAYFWILTFETVSKILDSSKAYDQIL